MKGEWDCRLGACSKIRESMEILPVTQTGAKPVYLQKGIPDISVFMANILLGSIPKSLTSCWCERVQPDTSLLNL